MVERACETTGTSRWCAESIRKPPLKKCGTRRTNYGNQRRHGGVKHLDIHLPRLSRDTHQTENAEAMLQNRLLVGRGSFFCIRSVYSVTMGQSMFSSNTQTKYKLEKFHCLIE